MAEAAVTEQSANAAQIAYWNDRAALTWTAFQERLDTLFEPLTVLALNAAAPSAGENVVDVGCGCGATVIALAHGVGASGRVLGLDVSEPMAARARERIEAAGLVNASVVIADAATHVFRERDIDLLFSRFGVMFFADPVAAFANLRTAMRPGGRLLCAVWRPMADNPWFSEPLAAASPLLPPMEAAEPNAPGPFAFADAGRTIGILTRAGWTDAAASRHDVPMRLGDAGQVDEAAEFATRVGALARALADQSPETRAKVKQAVADTLRGFECAEGIVLTGSIWLISARS